MPTVLIHILNEESVLGEVDEMPSLQDTLIFVKNPRKKDGKDLPYLQSGVDRVFWPLTRITFVELMPGGEDDENIIGFVRG